MIRISITAEAYEAIGATPPLRSRPMKAKLNAKGEWQVWVEGRPPWIA